MRIFIITLLAALIFCPRVGTADSATEALERDVMLLRSSLERPLQSELIRRGLTPRNADIAARHALDVLIECWKSERNGPISDEQSTTVIRLGGTAIVTYATPCMDEFLIRVGDLRQ